jgi:hypothetical protein
MSDPTSSARMPCDLCGSQTWEGDAHFIMGKLWCSECWAGQQPAVAMPPTASQRHQLELWVRPHRGAQT